MMTGPFDKFVLSSKPDECHPEIGFNTPLMNAITLISDEDVKKLMKHGASPIAKDVTGQTVEMLTKGVPVIKKKILSSRVVEVNLNKLC
jgi:hypothetical protein